MKSNLYYLLSIVCLSCFSIAVRAQVRVQKGVPMPDSAEAQKLIISLNGFLDQKEKPNNDNSYISQQDLLATSALIDELKEIEKNERLKDPEFCQPYLIDVLNTGVEQYTIQLAYMGVSNGTPELKATFRMVAQKTGDKYIFSSLLRSRTSNWKTKNVGNITFHYKTMLDKNDVSAFVKQVNFYDKKLQASKPIEHYYCDNVQEAQQLLGIDYNAANAGVVDNNITANEKDTSLILNGWSSGKARFDPHDLFHDRLRTVMNADIINRPVDEGCAYLYGGSWGYTWPQVQDMFRKYCRENPNSNWLQLYKEGKNFANIDGKTFKVSYFINALIVRQLEKEKGFNAVKQLLSCGRKEAGDHNYFTTLEKLTGITQTNFNDRVSALLAGYR